MLIRLLLCSAPDTFTQGSSSKLLTLRRACSRKRRPGRAQREQEICAGLDLWCEDESALEVV